jgi:hypothetical protein
MGNKPITIVTRKTCRRCNAVKTASLFHKHVKSKDGLQPYCKECISAYGKAQTKAKAKVANRAHRRPAKRTVTVQRGFTCINVNVALLAKARKQFVNNLPAGLEATDEQILNSVLTQLCN